MNDDTTAASSSESRDEPRTRDWTVPPAWRRYVRFLRLAVAKANADELALQSSALAFITILSLVPLLAVFSYVGALVFGDEPRRLVELMQIVLPYSEVAILEQLSGYLEQARGIRGFGFLGFLVTTLLAFITIDQTVNRIWSVTQHRPFHIRLRSFTLVLFWGPLVIGATYSSLFFLRQQSAFRAVEELTVRLVPFLVTLLGLTMLYWLVPYAAVRLRSALWGGLIASLLLELLRQGFGLYISVYQRMSTVYGSFALALIFMLSIQLAWWIVLLGSEVAYCVQHYEHMLRVRRSVAGLEGSWTGLAALLVIADRFRNGEPFTHRELLAERLQLGVDALERLMGPLIQAGLVARSRDREGYHLSCDPYRLPVRRVLACYEPPHGDMMAVLPPELARPMKELRARLVAARDGELGDLTVARLLVPPAEQDLHPGPQVA